MKLQEDGFVMTMAYPDFLYRPHGRVNLCPLFWRFLIMTFIARPALILVFTPILNIIGFLFTAEYYIPSWKECDIEHKKYKRWLEVRGMRIVPAVVLMIVGIAWLLIDLLIQAVSGMSAGQWIVIGLVALFELVLYFGFSDFDPGSDKAKSHPVRETLSLARAFVSAKYQKVCPVVELIKK
ncbi:MAG: hypothetical protein Q8P76_01955 [bacterium]|nr:hypothetical protein [bacterium]